MIQGVQRYFQMALQILRLTVNSGNLLARSAQACRATLDSLIPLAAETL